MPVKWCKGDVKQPEAAAREFPQLGQNCLALNLAGVNSVFALCSFSAL